jgi:DNA-binding CsgD family transcriptional regulator
MERLIEVGWDTEDSSFRQVFSTQFMPDADLQTFKAFNEAMRLCTSAANAVRIYRTFGQIDVEALAATLSCPTLVLHPRGDLRAPFDEGRRLASAIPEANFVPLESRNHIMLASEPAWQTCLDEIYRFYPPRTQPKKASAFPTLTPRQRDILELIAQGLDNAQIAARLELSEKTVRNTITQIFDRIEVENRSQAIVRARDAGLGSGG